MRLCMVVTQPIACIGIIVALASKNSPGTNVTRVVGSYRAGHIAHIAGAVEMFYQGVGF